MLDDIEPLTLTLDTTKQAPRAVRSRSSPNQWDTVNANA
jgi:hypothetical protein